MNPPPVNCYIGGGFLGIVPSMRICPGSILLKTSWIKHSNLKGVVL